MSTPYPAWGSTSGIVDRRVTADNDDAEERVSDGDMSLDSSDLELIRDGSNNQIVGIRFQNITVPRGSTITNAYIVFTTDEVSTETTNLIIRGHDHLISPEFSSPDYNISSRATTDAHVTWNNVPDWGHVGETGVLQQTPDLKDIVQEIIDRQYETYEWDSGNPMTFIITGTGKRVAESYNGNPSKAPLLHIEYVSDAVEVRVSSGDDDAEEASNGAINLISTDLELIQEYSEQTVGIRFQNVAVPQGAVITNAYLQFTADETTSQTTNLTIHGQASDSAPGFSASSYNITNGRELTGSHIVWNNVPAWSTVHETHRTPDLSTVVQEIVGRSGWASGNPMVFIITGSGKRVAESYNGEPEMAPLLRIEYGTEAAPYITTDTTNLGASCYQGSSPEQASFTVTNSGSVSMYYTITLTYHDGTDWLTLSPSGSTETLDIGESTAYTVTYSASALTPGTYDATIMIGDPNAPNSPVEIGVSLTVFELPAGASCGHVPVYTENLVSPAILMLLDISSSMGTLMPISSEDNPQTPSLAPIVQEIVDRPGWEYGNSMAFIITGTGKRTAVSYDGQSGSAPVLHVAYNDGSDHQIEANVHQASDDAEESSSGSVNLTSSDLELVYDGSNQTVGIRFQNVNIPKGETITITSAYIEFTIDEGNSGATSVTIYGEDMDNPSTFAQSNDNISNRMRTSASVAWDNIPEWSSGTMQSRIEIGKSVISDLVQDRAISWGYGTWCDTEDWTSDIDYTKIHVGCKFHDDAHQQALQDAITATVQKRGTPFSPSIVAAGKYFAGEKADQEGTGDLYVPYVCQPVFLIDVTDGRGNTDSTVANVEARTAALGDAGVTVIGVGFGLEQSEAEQLYKMAEIANEKGNESEDDQVYALHQENESGVGQPFFAYSKQELIDALATITESIKAAIFHGAAPAATTSTDLGDMVIVAKFDARDWSGELEALSQSAGGDWDTVLWKASENVPVSRDVFTIDPGTGTVIEYTDALLANDNHLCKPIGDIINSTPMAVQEPTFYYLFDEYETWKQSVMNRESMVYIGANDGSLHAFSLLTGVEKWAFFPLNLQAKLDMADDPTFDMCNDEYCHQYFVDGSPQVADIYNGYTWKTILVCGEREGGEAYFALDITYANSFDHPTHPTEYLWAFTDDELGQTWANPSIERVANKNSSGTTWGVFFGSGYAPTGQENKEAFLYGIVADSKGDLWWDEVTSITTNRIKISSSTLLNDALVSPLVVDLDADDISERIYVGNLYGTMYRVLNIRNGDTPTVDKLFDFDPSNTSPNLNPIRGKGDYAYGETPGNIWVYFGTGRYETQADKTNMQQQYFFGLRDSLSSPSTYTPADLALLEAKYVTDVTTGKQVRYIDGSNPSPYQSWGIKLYNGQLGYNGPSPLLGSERVVTKPLVAARVVFFSTFTPDQDVCAGNGDTWLFAVDYRTGLAPATPVFDLNDDGVIDELDKAKDELGNEYNVAAISVGQGKGSHPVLFKKTVFITTSGGGLQGENVNLPGEKVKLNTWKHTYR